MQYLQAKSNFEAGQKQLAAVKEQAAMYTIKSPINGYGRSDGSENWARWRSQAKPASVL